MGSFVKIAAASYLAPGAGRGVSAGGKDLALFNVGGAFHAIDGFCPHRGGPLGEGTLEGRVVECPWHGWQFDVTTGVSPVNPAAQVKTYPVKVEGSDILVEV